MNPEIDNVIARYFSGEATAKELAALDEWLAASEANEQVFEQMTQLFEKAAAFPTTRQPNTEKALQLFREHMRKREKTTNRFLLRKQVYWPAAAMLVLAIALTVFFLQPEKTTVQCVAANTEETVVLPDSTIVTLAPDSQISYSQHFGKQERCVQMTGKATFEVGTHGAGQFTVVAGDLFIRDIGTVFTVDAYAGNDNVNIAVATGAVLFTSIENPQETRLHAGETGVYHKASGSIETVRPTTIEPLVFDAATLQEVVTILLQRYGVAVRLTDASLAQRRISVRFQEEEDIHTILTVVSETLLLKLSYENDVYILSAQ